MCTTYHSCLPMTIAVLTEVQHCACALNIPTCPAGTMMVSPGGRPPWDTKLFSAVARDANLFFLNMLRQHSQYDSRLGFSFRVLVRVRVKVRVSVRVMVRIKVLGYALG